jgi:hypothetical protein
MIMHFIEFQLRGTCTKINFSLTDFLRKTFYISFYQGMYVFIKHEIC